MKGWFYLTLALALFFGKFGIIVWGVFWFLIFILVVPPIKIFVVILSLILGLLTVTALPKRLRTEWLIPLTVLLTLFYAFVLAGVLKLFGIL